MHSSSVRTLCPSGKPRSHSKLTRFSIVLASSSVAGWLSRIRTSTSECGNNSPRPYPPTAISAARDVMPLASATSRNNRSTERESPRNRASTGPPALKR